MRMWTLPALALILPGLALAQTPRALSGADIAAALANSGTVLPLARLPTGPGGVAVLDSTGKLPPGLIPAGTAAAPTQAILTTPGAIDPTYDLVRLQAAGTYTLPLGASSRSIIVTNDSTAPVTVTLAGGASVVLGLGRGYQFMMNVNATFWRVGAALGLAPDVATSTTPGLMKAGAGLLAALDGTVSVDSQVPTAATSVPALADLRLLMQDGTYLSGAQLKAVLGVP